MKTPLLYGLYTGLASALLNLVLYLLGYHSDPAKLEAAQMPSTLIGIGIGITGIILGIQARRSEYAPHEPFSYARALGAGVLVGVAAAVVSALAHVIYLTVINPDFKEIVLQQQVAAMEAKGMADEAIEGAMKFTRMMFNPALQFVFVVFAGSIFNTIISLIAAAFLRRPALQPAPVASEV